MTATYAIRRPKRNLQWIPFVQHVVSTCILVLGADLYRIYMREEEYMRAIYTGSCVILRASERSNRISVRSLCGPPLPPTVLVKLRGHYHNARLLYIEMCYKMYLAIIKPHYLLLQKYFIFCCVAFFFFFFLFLSFYLWK